jgi:hypothetical protein
MEKKGVAQGWPATPILAKGATPWIEKRKKCKIGFALRGGRTTPRLASLGVAEPPSWPMGV